jgi:hypothetical protein
VFPIEFEIQELHAEIGGRFPPKKRRVKPIQDIPPDGVGWVTEYPIGLEGQPIKEAITGILDFRLKYGRPGRRPYTLTKTFDLSVYIEDQKAILQHIEVIRPESIEATP